MSDHISHIIIQQYLDGKLDATARHELEKQALNDPFLSDALDGYAKASKASGYQLSILQKQLEERIAIKQESKNRFYFTWQRISIAAVGSMLFITSGILFWMNSQKHNRQIAVQTHKQVEVALSPQVADKTEKAIVRSTESIPNISRKQSLPAPSEPKIARSSNEAKVASVAQDAKSESGIVLVESAPQARMMVKNPKLNARVVVKSTPEGGWENYEDYLKKNTQFPTGAAEGDVIVSFSINAVSGSPENLKLVKGLTEAQNNEAFRVIEAGPKWQHATSEIAEVVVKFRH